MLTNLATYLWLTFAINVFVTCLTGNAESFVSLSAHLDWCSWGTISSGEDYVHFVPRKVDLRRRHCEAVSLSRVHHVSINTMIPMWRLGPDWWSFVVTQNRIWSPVFVLYSMGSHFLLCAYSSSTHRQEGVYYFFVENIRFFSFSNRGGCYPFSTPPFFQIQAEAPVVIADVLKNRASYRR